MSALWTLDAVQKLLMSPHKIVSAEPWRTWIERQGGLALIYAKLRRLPLKHQHAEVLATLLAHPGASVVVYQAKLGLERSGYHSRKKQLLSQLVAFLNTWEHTPPVPRPQPQHQLPTPLTSLIGRADDAAAVARRLRDPEVRLLTLIGPGGTGKTRLALHIAADMTAEYPDGVVFVPLGGLTDSALFPAFLAQRLKIKETSVSLIDSLKGYLAAKKMLLVLDNFEQLVEAGLIVADLLEAAPAVTALITSRRALNLYGEHRYPVPPLDVPPPGQPLSIEQLQECDSVRLFAARAQAVAPSWAINDSLGPQVAAICTRLDGLPLAIELAAARVMDLSPEEILRRLDERFQLLNDGPLNAPPRQRNLQATLAWSYDLLGGLEQRVFARLGVFTGGARPGALQHVCRDLAAPDSIASVLETLVLNNLLDRTDDVEGRIVMLETIHSYARHVIEASEEYASLVEDHALYYLDWVESIEAELKGPDQADRLADMSAEYLNIRAALHCLIRRDRRAEAERLCGALGRFWWIRGFLSEGQSFIQEAWQCSGQVSPRVAAKTLSAAGLLAYAQSNYATARNYYERCLAIRREHDDQIGIAAMLSNLGILEWVEGRLDKAIPYLEESVAIKQGSGDKREMATTLNNLAGVLCEQGRLAESERHYAESLSLKRECQDTWGVANTLINYGMVLYYQHRDHAEIMPLYAEGLALMLQLQDSWGISRGLFHRGLVACDEGHFSQACVDFHESVRLQQALGDTRGLLNSLVGLAQLLLSLGCRDQAARILRGVGTLRAEHGIPNSPQETIRLEEVFGVLSVTDDQTERSADVTALIGDALAWSTAALEPHESAPAAAPGTGRL